jgi:hypothetical protein
LSCNTKRGFVVAQILLIALLAAVSFANAESPGKRTSYAIPLAKLSVSFNDQNHQFEKVRVSFGSSDDESYYILIAPGDDEEIKVTKDGRQKNVHREPPDKAYMVSDFEADILNKVCKTLIPTLETFEKDLQHERWDRLLYLDSFFPRFLKGFYYLYCAARNSPYALPRGICIPDSFYDISLTSPKSDERIQMWQTQSDQILKLRMISKELIYQIREWQKKEIDNPGRNKEVSYGKKFEEAYTLFVKLYFNFQPLPDVPKEGEHL